MIEAELYYDPFDYRIDDDPYPIWARLRAEAPLYYNEKHNFYALSRYDDVAQALPDWQAYRSGRGTTADILFSGIEVPPGILLFEIHRCTTCTAGSCRGSSRRGAWRPSRVGSANSVTVPSIHCATSTASISSRNSAPSWRCGRSDICWAYPSPISS